MFNGEIGETFSRIDFVGGDNSVSWANSETFSTATTGGDFVVCWG